MKQIEVERKAEVASTGFDLAKSAWSPLAGKFLNSRVHRVVIRGQTVYLSGAFFGTPDGRDISSASSMVARSSSPRRKSSLTSTEVLRERASSPLRPRFSSDGLPPSVRPSLLVPERSSSVEVDNRVSWRETVDEVDFSKSVVRRTVDGDHLLQTSEGLPKTLVQAIAHSPFHKKHIVSVKQFSRSELHLLFNVAQEIRTLVERQGTIPLLNGRVMCSAFWEPSTRTSSSFETAMIRLGGNVVSLNQITSSIAKGESMADTVRTLSCYGDVVVMRHPEPGSASTAAKYAKVPVINAGDGVGEHPTQAFLDIFTIREELGTVNGLTITIVGDLKHGRTVHSLVKLLSHYHVKINYVSPASLRMPAEIKTEISQAGIPQHETTSLDEVIASTDVLYVTRIQKERFASLEDYNKVCGSYVITNKVLASAKKSHMIVMHPLPRINEIDPEVDFDQRAAYFRQMKYGLYVRMALLALVLGGRTSRT